MQLTPISKVSHQFGALDSRLKFTIKRFSKIHREDREEVCPKDLPRLRLERTFMDNERLSSGSRDVEETEEL